VWELSRKQWISLCDFSLRIAGLECWSQPDLLDAAWLARTSRAARPRDAKCIRLVVGRAELPVVGQGPAVLSLFVLGLQLPASPNAWRAWPCWPNSGDNAAAADAYKQALSVPSWTVTARLQSHRK
jgi:hypothetical protein